MENKNHARRTLHPAPRPLPLFRDPFQGGQKGSLLIGLIITMVIFSTLGGAMFYIFSSSVMNAVYGNYAQRAYYAAESGARYMIARYRHTAPQMTVAQYVALGGTVLTLPNNNGQAAITIADSMGGATTSVVTTVYTGTTQIALAGSLRINDASKYDQFPLKNGFFRIGAGTEYYRYQTRIGDTLYAVAGPGPWPITVVGGTTQITAPANQVSITSKGSYPQTGLFGMNRTVEYGWILSGSGGNAPPAIYEDGTTLTNWQSTPPGGSWGGVSLNPSEGALQIASINEGKSGALLGYGSPTYRPLYDAWGLQGSKLGYRAQLKVKATTTYFSAGLLLRVSNAGANYSAMGLSFAQGNAGENIPAAQTPVNKVPLIVLWKDADGQTNNMTTLAYKVLDTASGVFSAYFFNEKFTSSLDGNWNLTTHGGQSTDWALHSGSFVSSPTSARSGVTQKQSGSNPGESAMVLTTALDVPSNATLSFWHKGTFDATHTGTVYLSYNNGSSWTAPAAYTAAVNSWTLVTIPITTASTQFKMKFVVANTSNSNDTVNRWFIDDVRILTSPPSLTDYATLLAAVEEKILTAADVTAGFSIGQRVNDIRVYYSSPANNGGCNTTATDDIRNGNPRNQSPPCWPPCAPADTSCTVQTGSCTNDCFTLVVWDSVPGATITLLPGGHTLRTADAAFLTTAFPVDRPEFGISAFGNNVANNVYFDDFAVNFDCFGASGSPYLPPVQQ